MVSDIGAHPAEMIASATAWQRNEHRWNAFPFNRRWHPRRSSRLKQT